MEVKACSYKQDLLAAGLAFLMRSSAQRPLLGALRAFERPLFRRAHGPTLGSRRHKMRLRRQHKAPFVTGRVDDMIISGGENVSPADIIDRINGQLH